MLTDVVPPLLLCVEFVLALLLAGYLLYRYANIRKQNPFATVSTLIVWFLSFVIIFLLPVDVSSAFYRLCLSRQVFNITGSPNLTEGSCTNYVCADRPFYFENSEYMNNSEKCDKACDRPVSFVCMFPLEIMWYIIYWLFFVLSWLVLPLGQSYVMAGYFSVGKKILRALVENAVFYATFGVIFIILFIYLVVVEKVVGLANIPSLIATASNTWGLLILTLLLGYGLVEVPRALLNASRLSYTLKHCYFRAAKLYVDLAEANDKLQEVTERVKALSQSIHYNDPLRKHLNTIIKVFPAELQSEFNTGRDDYEDFKPTEDVLSKGSLESLYKKTTKVVRLARSSRIQWIALTDQAMDLEDIEMNAASSERRFKSSLRTPASRYNKGFLPILEWYWKVWCRPWVYRVLFVLLALFSIVIVWSEATFSININNVRLSVFAQLVYLGHALGKYIAVEVLSICVVAYMSVCAYTTVFRIRFFNLYCLAPRHNTDEYSLLFSAVILSRLALPICLNYLYIIQVVRVDNNTAFDNEIPQTAFALATGNTMLIPWLSGYFYLYYPALIVLVCAATVFSIGTRLASLLGYQKFLGEDDFSADFIDEGKALMKRERRIREKSIREKGKMKSSELHSEVVSEMLKEWQEERRRQRLRPLRSRDLDDDESRLSRIWVKAKGFATKKKVTFAARYSRRAEDNEELLEMSSSDSAHSHPSNSRHVSNSYSREPPKRLFDDI